MQIFNTMTRQKEEFVPLTPGEVKMYCCGPTVYNYIHVGNARPMILFDVLRRYLEYRGNKVTFVQNFTDVDDKIIKRANEEGTTSQAISEKYIDEYFKDAHGLGVRDATIHPKATENIQQIIDLVQTLIDKGYAYAVNGDVYYRTKKFADYGKLSHQPIEELQAGARIDVNDVKEDPLDFALWKAAKPGEPYWDSPWGQGRPGWHIECSAMSNRYLGKTIDIHCGGEDLQFPHHENEIAQSEAANGCKFVNYWLHNGFLNIDNQKMSKSLHNFFTVRDVANLYGYEPIRYFMLTAGYRMPLNYTVDLIESCKNSLERLYTCRENLDFALSKAEFGTDESLKEKAEEAKRKFCTAMDDDLNTPDALAAVFDLVKDINTLSASSSKEALETAAAAFDEITGVLGLMYNRKKDEVPAEVTELVEKRAAAKKAKDWASADAIRAQLGAGDRTVILSFGGSLGARRVNEVVADLCAWEQKEHKPVLHIHATGQYGVELFQNLEKEKGFAPGESLVVKEYINNMPELLAAADLVISRAGALTLAELEAVGRAAVLIPSPNVAENHQYYNAMELQKAGAAVVIEEKDLTGEKLVQTVSEMLTQPGKLAEMGRNARSLSVDDSLDRITAALLKLVKTP